MGWLFEGIFVFVESFQYGLIYCARASILSQIHLSIDMFRVLMTQIISQAYLEKHSSP
jgi:hypothetical protein